MSYTSQIAAATRLMKRYGQAVTWTKRSVAVNPTQPWKATQQNPPQQFTVFITFLRPSGSLTRYLYHLIKGTDIPTGAPRGLMAPVPGLTPEITDNVVRNGSALVIKAINPIAPADAVILYEIEFA